VTGYWAGLRPLVSDARSERSADLSRRHAIVTSANGLITVTGGKLTTYRRMAADTVDAVGRQLADRRIKRSPTSRLRLVGCGVGDRSSARDQIAVGLDLAPATLRHLAGRYGSETAEVIGLCRSDPSLRDPLIPGLPYLRAEAVWAVRREMAHSLIDLLSRRTRALMLDRAATVRAAGDVARLLAGELAWDRAEESRQLAVFHQVAADESGASLPSRPAAPARVDSSPGR
jgi:glycerol-3-phosphate dehydrogenase